MASARLVRVLLMAGVVAAAGISAGLWLRSAGGPIVPDDRMAEPGQPRLPLAKPRWTFDAGGAVDSPPVTDGRLVFVGSEADNLHALDAAGGRQLWNHSPRGHLWTSSLALGEGRLYVGSEGGELTALDPDTGRVVWRRTLAGEMQYAPLVHGDTLYATTTFVGARMTSDPRGRGRVYALRAADGKVVWERETDSYLLRSPVRDGDTLYVGGPFLDPRPVDEGGHLRLYALDPHTGKVRWTHESEDGLLKNLHAHGKRLAFLAYTDLVHGLDAGSGEPVWSYNTENWVHGFAAAGDRVYFGSANGFVHALDVASGRMIWKYECFGVFNYIVGAPVLRDGVLYFHTTFREVHALDAGTGRPLWRARDGVEARGPVATDGRRLYLGSVDGKLYAFDLPRRARS